MATVFRPEIIPQTGEDDFNLEGRDEKGVDNFLASLKFFPTPRTIAVRILQLNQALGDSLVEEELEALSSVSLPSIEDERVEKGPGWVNSLIAKVSSILFHGEYAYPEQPNLSGEGLVSFFQKVVSERIYDHLSFLSLSPHAREGLSFSIMEELTDGIAEDIGLRLYRNSEMPQYLREQSREALFDLAAEFQRWLLEERGGSYTAGWGEIRAKGNSIRDEEAMSHFVVWLEPDVETRTANRLNQSDTVAAAG
jgi:hypothetical protein